MTVVFGVTGAKVEQPVQKKRQETRNKIQDTSEDAIR